MTQRTYLFIGLFLIVIATIPHVLVTPIVGPINFFFSLLVSSIYMTVAWLTKRWSGWLGVVLAIPFGFVQFVTPVPYWVCADAGYSFCPSIAGTALKSAVFNAADALIIVLFISGYVLTLLGMKAAVRSSAT